MSNANIYSRRRQLDAEAYDRVSGVLHFSHGQTLLKELHLQAGQKVLDLGCGTGSLGLSALSSVLPHGQVVGVEPDEQRLSLAQKRTGGGFTVFQGSAENLEFLDAESFDVVYLNSVYHWLHDKDTALQQIHRILKPGGLLGLSGNSKEWPHAVERLVESALTLVQSGEWNLPKDDHLRFSSHDIARQLSRNQFEVESIHHRTYDDHFASVDDLLDFYEASSFGRYFAELPIQIKEKVARVIERHFEPSHQAILRLQRHILFAFSRKI